MRLRLTLLFLLLLVGWGVRVQAPAGNPTGMHVTSLPLSSQSVDHTTVSFELPFTIGWASLMDIDQDGWRDILLESQGVTYVYEFTLRGGSLSLELRDEFENRTHVRPLWSTASQYPWLCPGYQYVENGTSDTFVAYRTIPPTLIYSQTEPEILMFEASPWGYALVTRDENSTITLIAKSRSGATSSLKVNESIINVGTLTSHGKFVAVFAGEKTIYIWCNGVWRILNASDHYGGPMAFAWYDSYRLSIFYVGENVSPNVTSWYLRWLVYDPYWNSLYINTTFELPSGGTVVEILYDDAWKRVLILEASGVSSILYEVFFRSGLVYSKTILGVPKDLALVEIGDTDYPEVCVLTTKGVFLFEHDLSTTLLESNETGKLILIDDVTRDAMPDIVVVGYTRVTVIPLAPSVFYCGFQPKLAEDYPNNAYYYYDYDYDGLHAGQEREYKTSPTTQDTDADGLDDLSELSYTPYPLDPTDPDTDNDGLEDGDEVRLGTDPLKPDTDGDGVEDGREVLINTDPLNPDTDGDGLKDGEELDLGTDPLNPDTDGDELNDSYEVQIGTNPTSNDTDADGLTDSQELQFNTSPTDNDTDDDGLTDGVEVRMNLNPLDNDSDDDGLIDGQEVSLGTNPLDPDSDDDGLTDGEEVSLGTNPLSNDTDHDGLSDKTEVLEYGTDPTSNDTDEDGVSDLQEIMIDTDPKNPDTDGDGLKDGEELQLGLDPSNPDTDHDGASDYEEIQKGWDPLDPDMDDDGIPDGYDPTPLLSTAPKKPVEKGLLGLIALFVILGIIILLFKVVKT